jgi:serine/arginine repetitive matrix protein 2
MQALLEHSVQSYGPLPSELRSRRVRTSSRTSPYPQSRVSKITISPDQIRPTHVEEVPKALATPVLQEVKVNMNVKSSAVPSLEAIKPFSTMFLDVEPSKKMPTV